MQYELYHHGILGMKWGVRRYQNKDGSLTAAGKKRYGSQEALDVDRKLNEHRKESNKIPLTRSGVIKNSNRAGELKKQISEQIISSSKELKTVLQENESLNKQLGIVDEKLRKKADALSANDLENYGIKRLGFQKSDFMHDGGDNDNYAFIRDYYLEQLRRDSKEHETLCSKLADNGRKAFELSEKATKSLLGSVGDEPYTKFVSGAESKSSVATSWLRWHILDIEQHNRSEALGYKHRFVY